jgi:hypothetical protein
MARSYLQRYWQSYWETVLKAYAAFVEIEARLRGAS